MRLRGRTGCRRLGIQIELNWNVGRGVKIKGG